MDIIEYRETATILMKTLDKQRELNQIICLYFTHLLFIVWISATVFDE